MTLLAMARPMTIACPALSLKGTDGFTCIGVDRACLGPIKRTRGADPSLGAPGWARIQIGVPGHHTAHAHPSHSDRTSTLPTNCAHHFASPHAFKSGQKRGVHGQIKKELRRRSAIEAVIGHCKTDGHLDRNFLPDLISLDDLAVEDRPIAPSRMAS